VNKYFIYLIILVLTACSSTPKKVMPYSVYEYMYHQRILISMCVEHNFLKEETLSSFDGVINYYESTWDYIDPSFHSRMKKDWGVKYGMNYPNSNICNQSKNNSIRAYSAALLSIKTQANNNLIKQQKEQKENRMFWAAIAGTLKGLSHQSLILQRSNNSSNPSTYNSNYNKKSNVLYDASGCTGIVVNGSCTGYVKPNTPKYKCHGTVLQDGTCSGTMQRVY
jgi:hypothetical protein